MPSLCCLPIPPPCEPVKSALQRVLGYFRECDVVDMYWVMQTYARIEVAVEDMARRNLLAAWVKDNYARLQLTMAAPKLCVIRKLDCFCESIRCIEVQVLPTTSEPSEAEALDGDQYPTPKRQRI